MLPKKELNIYPNPVLTNLTIVSKNPVNITFYDILGNLILNTNKQTNKQYLYRCFAS